VKSGLLRCHQTVTKVNLWKIPSVSYCETQSNDGTRTTSTVSPRMFAVRNRIAAAPAACSNLFVNQAKRAANMALDHRTNSSYL
jgi:hypothetical protein